MSRLAQRTALSRAESYMVGHEAYQDFTREEILPTAVYQRKRFGPPCYPDTSTS